MKIGIRITKAAKTNHKGGKSLTRKIAIFFALMALAVMAFSVPAMANSTYFGKLPANLQANGCGQCHPNGAPPALNDYGKSFKANGYKVPSTSTPTKPPSSGNTTTPKPAKPAAPTMVKKSVNMTSGDKQLKVDGVVVNSRTLVPVRTVSEFFGGGVNSWDAAKKQVSIKVAGKTIIILAGKDKATVNGQEVTLDTGANIVNARVYIPIRFVGETLGAKVNYDATKGITLILIDPNAKTPEEIAKEEARAKKTAAITAMWSESGHATPVEGPSLRDTCINCHNGEGFDKNLTKVADLTDQVIPIGQTCTTCHGDRGKEIRNGGVVTLANGKTVNAGRGALCMSCHNGRRNLTDALAKRQAPHRGPQADVLTATGGMEVAGKVYPSSPHAANPDTCVTCHMARNEEGYANHRFTLSEDLVTAACGSCHEGLETFNRTALGDFDGNGKTEGIQTEVEGLVIILQAAVDATLTADGITASESHGGFVFQDKDANAAVVSDAIAKALWNLVLIENDGSHGVHNPAYVVSLLQQSYKEVTGQDVPGARLR